MFRAQLPRFYELRDVIADPTDPNAYFPHDLETRLRQKPFYLKAMICLEKKLDSLDADAWAALKAEASPSLTIRDLKYGRGWSQLNDVLHGHTDAYRHLRDIGCSNVRFVPRSEMMGQKTPDIEGSLDSRRVLCEVKTMNISDDEIKARCNPAASKVKSQLDNGFLRKFQDNITKAKEQLDAYDPTGEALHLVYISICFDEWAGIYREDNFRQIECHVKDYPVPGMEVVFWPRKC